jgi:NTE family protein
MAVSTTTTDSKPLRGFHTVLVSDGGTPFDSKAKAPMNWLSQSLRTTAIINSQVRANRTQELVRSLKAGERLGALWTIGTPITKYPLGDRLPVESDFAIALHLTPTRLKALDDKTQKRLVNLGYAQADAAIRSYVESSYPPPHGWPHPDAALG